MAYETFESLEQRGDLKLLSNRLPPVGQSYRFAGLSHFRKGDLTRNVFNRLLLWRGFNGSACLECNPSCCITQDGNGLSLRRSKVPRASAISLFKPSSAFTSAIVSLVFFNGVEDFPLERLELVGKLGLVIRCLAERVEWPVQLLPFNLMLLFLYQFFFALQLSLGGQL